MSGAVNEETRAYTKVDDRTLELVGKSSGKVTVKARVMISEDGKTRTVTTAALWTDAPALTTLARCTSAQKRCASSVRLGASTNVIIRRT